MNFLVLFSDILHNDCRVADLLDYTADDLTGQSIYGLVHAADTDKIKQTHNDCKFD